METIVVSGLRKYYRVHKKEPGLLGSIAGFFRRRWEIVKAVDGISFKIAPGELVGFIGPNGAGKTTTLKCLSGLLYPDEGFISVLGFNPWERRPAFLRQIAFVMGQKNQLWWDLPPMETFLLNKAIYEIPPAQFEQTLTQLINMLEVDDVVRVQTRKLSLGQRMKCELIAALLHRPKVLFLDEPTIGLDVVAQKKIRQFIAEYNRLFGATIILTSHYMGDVQELAQRVIIIDKGKLVFDGALEKIVDRFVTYKMIQVVFAKKPSKKSLSKLGKLQTFNGLRATLLVPRQKVSKVVSKLLQQFVVSDLTIKEPPIEEIIRQLFTTKKYA